MHQGHNIPWDTISTNFKFSREDKRFTPPLTGLMSRDKPGAQNELRHFIKKFTAAIRTFSDTERAKYPATFTPLSSGNLFTDELREKHSEYLTEHNQRIEYWIASAQWNVSEDGTSQPTYNTGQAELAEVVKVLLYENEMETLLMLANHPLIPLASLRNLHWGHHFGFSRVMESALRAYLFFNVAEATGILENGSYASMRYEYASLLSELSGGMDYPAQQIPHQKFLEECGVFQQNRFRWVYGDKWEESENVIHKDYGRLQEYLKTLFALMYRYDVLVRECGLVPEWEDEMVLQWPLRGNVKMEWDDALGKSVIV
ncbi:hypothetical protein GALMADRAFT_260068 [Galerina marginata CBS 339.88]|uniref:Uncharacterized protein n=1 Tax=Galerina marginata (strain CBS 339.88) TaxID=685588 RepID=A0A067SDN5_GALM3|nr:hypothetical protein GALMADRAFT_260068 [Galerina marginata CBS 339.88]